MVTGNRGSGKSFFCDKILNLSEVRGNHVSMDLWSFVVAKIQVLMCGPHPLRKRISRFFCFKSMGVLFILRSSRYCLLMQSW